MNIFIGKKSIAIKISILVLSFVFAFSILFLASPTRAFAESSENDVSTEETAGNEVAGESIGQGGSNSEVDSTNTEEAEESSDDTSASDDVSAGSSVDEAESANGEEVSQTDDTSSSDTVVEDGQDQADNASDVAINSEETSQDQEPIEEQSEEIADESSVSNDNDTSSSTEEENADDEGITSTEETASEDPVVNEEEQVQSDDSLNSDEDIVDESTLGEDQENGEENVDEEEDAEEQTEETAPEVNIDILFSTDEDGYISAGEETNFSIDLEGVDIAECYWDFGDGSDSLDKNPNHIYKKDGNYTQTVTIVDSNGNSYSKTITVHVSDHNPYTTEWYVSPDAVSNAEDFEDGNSSENPVSIDSVLSHIVDGDILYFLSGTYTSTYTEDESSNISLDNIGTGTEDNSISFVGYDGTIFDGGNTIDHAFSLTSSLSYLGFYNFTFINYLDSAIYIDDQEVTNIDVVDNTFADNGTAIDITMDSDLNIENNIIVDNSTGIDISSDNANIEHNIVVDNSGGIKVDDTRDNVSVDYNDVYNNEEDYSGTEPGENDISVDPKFVDKEALDFSLQEDSPLLGSNIIRIVQTDKEDYSYNEQVIIAGSGYSPNQELILKILRPDGTFVEDIAVTTDINGSFVCDGYSVDYAGKNYLIKITDTDGNILEVLSFTDVNTWYVSTTGDDDTGDGSSGNPWKTIQYATDHGNVSNEDTVNVEDGTYTITKAITVDKEVTITGNVGNPENVVVTYSSASQTLDCFDMQANDITVQGISVVNGRYGFNFAASDPTGCTISNCVIDHAYDGAINIDGGSGHTISNNTITNCLTSGTKGGAIYIYGCPDVTIDGNTLTDNGLTGNHATMGIYVKFTYPSSSSERVEIINNNISGMLGINADIQVYDAPYTYIYNNTISNSEDKGIAIFGINGSPAYNSTDNRVEVIGNTISSTYYPGLQAANAPYTYFYNNTLTHCNYYGGDSTGDFDYASIHIDTGSANCLIDNNTVSDGINGIQLWSDSCTVTNNTIYDMGKTYTNTKITGDGTYYNSAILYGDMYDVNMPTSATISNNNIYDNYWGLFVISAYTGTVTAEKNWWGNNSGPHNATSNSGGTGDDVSDNVDYSPWLGATPGTSPMTWYTNDSIQDAIDAATSGDTINVTAGIHSTANNGETFPITISIANITLKGAQFGVDPTVEGVRMNPDEESIIDAAGSTSNAIEITADGVIINGFTIKNAANYGVKIGDSDQVAETSNIEVSHCMINENKRGVGLYYITSSDINKNIISNNSGTGMYINHATSTTTIENNIVTGNDGYGGILLSSNPGSPTNPIIESNTITNNPRGIYLYGVDIEPQILGNTINDNTDTGIQTYITEGGTFKNNTIENNGGDGICLGAGQSGSGQIRTIEDNIISGNHGNGIEGAWFCKNQIIKNNIISNNDEHGISIKSATVEITNNDIFDNGSDGIFVDVRRLDNGTPNGPDPDVTARFNNIYNNTNYGVEFGYIEKPSITVDATKNWWGDAGGPTHASNPGGTGNAVSDNVDYSPWLGAISSITPMTWYTNDSIQDAVTAASSGDTINVLAGTYGEQVLIDDKDLIIQGANIPVITGVSDAEYIIKVANANITLDGLTINGAGNNIKNGIWYYDDGSGATSGAIINCTVENIEKSDGSQANIRIENSPVDITNNTIKGFFKNGIFVRDSGSIGTISGNEIICRIIDNVTEVQYGVQVGWGANVTIQNNTIYDSTIASVGLYDWNWASSGILVLDSSATTGSRANIISNNIHHCMEGVHIGYQAVSGDTSYGLIKDNQIHDCFWCVGVVGDASADIQNNTIKMLDQDIINFVSPWGEGIFVGGGWTAIHEHPMAVITGNTIDNFDMGIDIYENADVTIRGNDIVDCDYGVKTNIADPVYNPGEIWAQTITAHINNIVGNSEYGVDNSENSATLDATNNWWGDESGPDTVGPGSGDNVSTHVDYDPWLLSQYYTPYLILADITSNKNSTGIGETINFDASGSTVIFSSLYKYYYWDWDGNGTYDEQTTDPIVSHQFNAPGTYNVKLMLTDFNGDTSEDTTITTIANASPAASAGGSYRANAGSSIQFNGSASSDSDGTITSYSWNFGDGKTGSGVNPTHSYSSAGTYTVTLTVTDNWGATNTDTATASINASPVASAGGSYRANAGSSIQFNGSASSDSDGTITSYSWNFGDGKTGSGVNPTHSYSSAGTYTVTLTVTDNDHAKDSASATVTIQTPPPQEPEEEKEELTKEESHKQAVEKVEQEASTEEDTQITVADEKVVIDISLDAVVDEEGEALEVTVTAENFTDREKIDKEHTDVEITVRAEGEHAVIRELPEGQTVTYYGDYNIGSDIYKFDIEGDIGTDDSPFSKEVELTLEYDEDIINPTLAYWDEESEQWVTLDSSIVDPNHLSASFNSLEDLTLCILDDVSTQVVEVIDASAGGIVENVLEDVAITLDILSGAVDEDIEVAITQVTVTENIEEMTSKEGKFEIDGKIYDFRAITTEDGTKVGTVDNPFGEPVTITLECSPGTENPTIAWFNPETGTWEEVETVRIDDTHVSASVYHFSKWAVLEPIPTEEIVEAEPETTEEVVEEAEEKVEIEEVQEQPERNAFVQFFVNAWRWIINLFE